MTRWDGRPPASRVHTREASNPSPLSGERHVARPGKPTPSPCTPPRVCPGGGPGDRPRHSKSTCYVAARARSAHQILHATDVVSRHCRETSWLGGPAGRCVPCKPVPPPVVRATRCPRDASPHPEEHAVATASARRKSDRI